MDTATRIQRDVSFLTVSPFDFLRFVLFTGVRDAALLCVEAFFFVTAILPPSRKQFRQAALLLANIQLSDKMSHNGNNSDQQTIDRKDGEFFLPYDDKHCFDCEISHHCRAKDACHIASDVRCGDLHAL